MTTQAELEAAWKARCETGTFSPGVLGIGTIKVMGKSGDAPVTFPRITSLAVLEELTPDEQYAVAAAQAVIREAREAQRPVMQVTPGTHQGKVVTDLPTDAETLVVLLRVAGG